MDGFTLLELLGVLLLVGVLIGMVGIVGNSTPQRQAQQQGRLFIQLLQHARQQAVLEGREYAIRFDTQDFQLMKWRGGSWETAGKVQSTGMDLRLEVDGHVVGAGEGDRQPQLLVLSSDETSAFRLHFEQAGLRMVSVSSDGLNEALIDE
ncbi:GspH/FimT family protein [Pseudomonas akapageensis]|uniref:GspH/FimT family protein n=1 Tax=Pseudomonas akapageensis TaxID=2609961 RepID=UPI00140B4989|nr:GspH/FimT family protein [Pseudomonas akapageensis]